MYPALLTLMRTPRLPVVDCTDAPTDLNGLVRFAERRNHFSVRVPSHFNWPLATFKVCIQDSVVRCHKGEHCCKIEPADGGALTLLACILNANAKRNVGTSAPNHEGIYTVDIQTQRFVKLGYMEVSFQFHARGSMLPSKSCRCPLKRSMFGHQSLSRHFGEERVLPSSRESYKNSVGVVSRLRAGRARNRGSILDRNKETFPSLPDLGLTKLSIKGVPADENDYRHQVPKECVACPRPEWRAQG